MRKSTIFKYYCILFLFLFSLVSKLSAEQAGKISESSNPVILAYQIERTDDFLLEPGNNPVEILRRFARAINQTWPKGKKSLIAASTLNMPAFGKPEFLKPVSAALLTKQQQEQTNHLLQQNSEDLASLLAECFPATKGLTIKIACDVKVVAQKLQDLIQGKNAAAPLSEQQLDNIKNQFLPLIDRADQILLAGSISLNGIFFRARIKSEADRLYDEKTSHNLSISPIINHKHLMIFAQTFPIEDPEDALDKLHAIPQTQAVLQLVASAGLDFKKDILALAARESVLYVNLEPAGPHGWPDIRFVAPVPDENRLRSNLPKFKALCSQTGIFAKPVDENGMPLVELSYFMFPDKPVFVGMQNKYLIIASSREAIADESKYISATQESNKVQEKDINSLKRFWRVKSDNLNFQLQRFLQSPLLRDKGIPPISNLTFFNDLEDLEIYSTSTPEEIKFFLDLPIKPQKEK